MSQTSGAQQRKNTNYAPLVGSFRGSTEEKHELRPACRKLPGLNREKTWITPRLSQTSGAQQRKNVDYRAFRNVGYNKCRDAHRGRMFRLLWTFVDLKLPSAMSHAIHKIVSKERCQSYFIDGCRRIKIERNNLLCEQAPTEVFRSIFAWLVARLTFNYSQYFNNSNGWAIIASAWPSSSSLRSRKPQRTPTVKAPAALPVFMSVAVSPM